jgi:hypothetical protein
MLKVIMRPHTSTATHAQSDGSLLRLAKIFLEEFRIGRRLILQPDLPVTN